MNNDGKGSQRPRRHYARIPYRLIFALSVVGFNPRSLAARVWLPAVRPSAVRMRLTSNWRTSSENRAPPLMSTGLDDGIADSGHEVYTVEFPLLGPGEHSISLRTFDSSGNVGTLSITVRR